MRTLIMLTLLATLSACVQDEGEVDSSSVSDDSGSTTGSTSGGSTGGSSGTPTDPLYVYQWHLNNTGQDVFADEDYLLKTYFDFNDDGNEDSGEEIDIDHDIDEVHNGTTRAQKYRGAGVKIAISDSGTDYTHLDLDDNNLLTKNRNYSFLDPDRWEGSEAYPSGNSSHGTAVAGIALAEGWNNYGGRGVAPEAEYAAFKFIISDSQDDHDTSNLAKTLHQIDSGDDDFDIFNYSYGFSQAFFTGFEFWDSYDSDSVSGQAAVLSLYEANVANPITALRGGKGAIYVQSAGNDYNVRDSLDVDPTDDLYDFSYAGNTNSSVSTATAYTIVTAAVNSDGVKASYSTPGSGIWVSGIGGEGMTDVDPLISEFDERYVPAIYTADIGDCSSGFSFRSFVYRLKNPFNYGYNRTLNASCDHTNMMNGTSSAAPMVSGVVALMLEADPNLTWRDVKYILAITSDPIDYFPGSVIWEDEIPHPEYGDITGYPTEEKWMLNGASRLFSNWYGFGLVNADEAVKEVLTRKNASTYLGPYLTSNNTNASAVLITNNDVTAPASSVITVTDAYLIEAIEVTVNTTHPDPGQLAVHLTCPHGTHTSRLLNLSSEIFNTFGETRLQLLTNAFLDEESDGVWTLEVFDDTAIGSGSVTSWSMKIHGRAP